KPASRFVDDQGDSVEAIETDVLAETGIAKKQIHKHWVDLDASDLQHANTRALIKSRPPPTPMMAAVRRSGR
ncbi:MAG: hypothetical protein ABWZ88_02395, partial [Variovorax sp.]